jgi:hypothetical protein
VASEFVYLKRDGTWSNHVSRAKDVAVAAGRLVIGRGPFSMTRDGHTIFQGKTRRRSLRQLGRYLDDSKIGEVFRIRNGQGSIIFSTRAVAAKPAVDPRRLDMVRWARWGIGHQGSIHYSQARPIPQYNKGHLPMTLDCSGSTVTYARWSNIPSPTGSYSGGSTDTILAHCKKIERRELQVGDLCLWAYGSDGKHVAVVIETGPDPLLASHGMEAGPLAIRLSAEDRYHSSETLHYLSILG